MAEPAPGTVGPEDLVQEEPAPVDTESGTKTNKEVADEVIAGRWGRGNVRKRRLQEAGYDVAAVSEEISKIFSQ